MPSIGPGMSPLHFGYAAIHFGISALPSRGLACERTKRGLEVLTGSACIL
jgi:hypothetical protein